MNHVKGRPSLCHEKTESYLPKLLILYVSVKCKQTNACNIKSAGLPVSANKITRLGKLAGSASLWLRTTLRAEADSFLIPTVKQQFYCSVRIFILLQQSRVQTGREILYLRRPLYWFYRLGAVYPCDFVKTSQ